MTYYAKSKFPDGRQVTAKEHSAKVAEWAGYYGEHVGLSEQAYNAGLTHDFGKWSELFKGVLDGETQRVDHAMAGGALLSGMKGFDWQRICEAVAGHHEGLMGFGTLEPYFRQILRGQGPCISPMPKQRTVSLSGTEEFKAARSAMLSDFGGRIPFREMDDSHVKQDGDMEKLSHMMMSRMLLSCLCDADFTVSAWEEQLDGGLFDEGKLENAKAYLEKLVSLHDSLCLRSRADSRVNDMRSIVWKDCGRAGRDITKKFCTLTAPTGSGKTMGMLRFALGRALADHTIEHIILVLPFLSLTDQVAKAVAGIFGCSACLRHDSVSTAMDGEDDGGTASDRDALQRKKARWSVPVVVTTTVQLFQSLFGDKPADVRKLHRLGRSVVILDEVQALPVEMQRMCIMALQCLSQEYGTHVLLSTATQPAFQHIDGVNFRACETIRDVGGLFRMVRRTGIEMRKGGPARVEDIAAEAAAYRNSCAIFNLKRHAKKAYDALVESGAENVFLISTDLCPEHRKAVLNEVKRLQMEGKPVHVAATQCIEAGIDLDFEKVFRALAPLTSLIQAAGRQNRNGLYPDGDITVFEVLEEDGRCRAYPDSAYQRQAMVVKEMLAAGAPLSGMDGIEEYYRRVFSDHARHEPKKLSDALRSIDFAGFAKESRLIRNDRYRIVVPYRKDGSDSRYEAFRDAVLGGRFRISMLGDVAGICVQVFADKLDGLSPHITEAVAHDYRSGRDIHTGTYVLLDEPCYDSSFGLGRDISPGGAIFM